MNPFSRWFRPRDSGTKRPDSWLVDWFRGTDSDSGVKVNARNCLTYAPVWQAVNVIAGDLSQLPLVLYRRLGENKQRAHKHAAYKLIKRRPNPYMNVGTFKQILQSHALLWGNGYAEIERDERARPTALNVLLPDRTEPMLDGSQLWYVTKVGDVERKLRPENVLHVKGLGFDGLRGYSVITLARNSWGLGLSAEKYSNKFFANDARPSGVLEHPKHLTEEAATGIRRSWNKIHEGLDNTARIAILWEGMQFKPMSMSNRDSQWLEGRHYQRTDVASWFNLPPHKVGDLEHATFTNIEEQNRDYLNMSLMRWLVAWQEECHEKLLTEREKEQDQHVFDWITEHFLKGDLAKRTAAQVKQVLNGRLTINEWRAQENQNGIGPTGDLHFFPTNMTTLEALAAKAEQEKAAAASVAPAGEEEVTEQLAKLIRVEVQRVRTAAKHAGNFRGWVDSFYSRWPETLRAAVTELGGDASLADDHCDCSRGELLAVCDAENWQDLVSDLLAIWPARAAELADFLIVTRRTPGGQTVKHADDIVGV